MTHLDTAGRGAARLHASKLPLTQQYFVVHKPQAAHDVIAQHRVHDKVHRIVRDARQCRPCTACDATNTTSPTTGSHDMSMPLQRQGWRMHTNRALTEPFCLSAYRCREQLRPSAQRTASCLMTTPHSRAAACRSPHNRSSRRNATQQTLRPGDKKHGENSRDMRNELR